MFILGLFIMDKELQKWRDEGKHLPKFLRDFHDQKDFFKYLHDSIDTDDEENKVFKEISAREGHIYCIDYVLYILAKYGYTLQKSRAQYSFENLSDSIEKNNEYRKELFTQAMLNLQNKPNNEE